MMEPQVAAEGLIILADFRVEQDISILRAAATSLWGRLCSGWWRTMNRQTDTQTDRQLHVCAHIHIHMYGPSYVHIHMDTYRSEGLPLRDIGVRSLS